MFRRNNLERFVDSFTNQIQSENYGDNRYVSVGVIEL